jgi:hypothetical protein
MMLQPGDLSFKNFPASQCLAYEFIWIASIAVLSSNVPHEVSFAIFTCEVDITVVEIA